MALIQVEGNGIQADWCTYCTKSDLVFMWCAEYATASLLAVIGAIERDVGLSICGGWLGVSK